MTRNRSPSMLHIQMGQEVIYLLLAASLAAAIVLAIVSTRQQLLINAQATALAQARAKERTDQPPIISLGETDGYFFRSGRADLSTEFSQKLRDVVVPKLLANRDVYNVHIVEIIGHTDEQPLGLLTSTMDGELIQFVTNADPAAGAPLAVDNVGLGMARAAAVGRALRLDTRMAGMTILVYSAGQTITADGQASDGRSPRSDKTRRRIEIRMKRQR